jgi:hypothetical protein
MPTDEAKLSLPVRDSGESVGSSGSPPKAYSSQLPLPCRLKSAIPTCAGARSPVFLLKPKFDFFVKHEPHGTQAL